MEKLQARNETIINAPVATVWAVITDINLLHKVNPGVVKATGRMDLKGATRTCEIDNNGRKESMTEKLIELVPEQKTVWTIEEDTMGMSKMLRNTCFVFNIEKLEANKVKVISETYYQPASIIAKIMNVVVMKKMILKAQTQILANIKTLTEK